KARPARHERMAGTAAEVFPRLMDSAPGLLPRHCEGAGMAGEAIFHWRKARMAAMTLAANLEAIAHLKHAVELVTAQPSTAEGLQQELAIQLALGPAQMAIKGWASAEVEAASARALVL